MINVIGIRFKMVGKIYYFNPGDVEVEDGDNVIVETVRGIEFGTVVLKKEINEDEFDKPLKSVIRKATDEDIRINEENKVKAKEAYSVCSKKIDEHKLEMNLVEAEYTFDGSKLLFYFTAEGRIDFRDLVKDLATVFRTRIELRQIGVRDESKILGSIGVCGRPICCSQFLDDFVPVSIKMAKEQGLSLNPTKISGTCGRLMCCLKYEQDGYEDMLRTLPRVGAIVDTPDGKGKVDSVNVLKQLVYVKLEGEIQQTAQEFRSDEIKIIKNIRNGKENEKIDEEILKTLED